MVFKQLLQLDAIDVCQIDSCRLGGVNEILSVLLMSAKFGVPVCPHAGGVGLCEYVVSNFFFFFLISFNKAVNETNHAVCPRSTCLLLTIFASRVIWSVTSWSL